MYLLVFYTFLYLSLDIFTNTICYIAIISLFEIPKLLHIKHTYMCTFSLYIHLYSINYVTSLMLI